MTRTGLQHVLDEEVVAADHPRGDVPSCRRRAAPRPARQRGSARARCRACAASGYDAPDERGQIGPVRRDRAGREREREDDERAARRRPVPAGVAAASRRSAKIHSRVRATRFRCMIAKQSRPRREERQRHVDARDTRGAQPLKLNISATAASQPIVCARRGAEEVCRDHRRDRGSPTAAAYRARRRCRARARPAGRASETAASTGIVAVAQRQHVAPPCVISHTTSPRAARPWCGNGTSPSPVRAERRGYDQHGRGRRRGASRGACRASVRGHGTGTVAYSEVPPGVQPLLQHEAACSRPLHVAGARDDEHRPRAAAAVIRCASTVRRTGTRVPDGVAGCTL